MTIANWLNQAIALLQDISTTPRLDALILLEDETKKSRAWLLAHTEELLSSKQSATLQIAVQRRATSEPLAYIRGKQAFFGRDFAVTPAVLIPRPETETLVEYLLTLPLYKNDTLFDIGTGSGAIAITVKCEKPELQVFASDISQEALIIAKKNAALLNTEVTFLQSNLLQGIPKKEFTLIAANLPYVDPKWERSIGTNFEPKLALLAKNKGLEFIFKLLAQTPIHLKASGFLLLEADPRQHPAIVQAAKPVFNLVYRQDFCLAFRKN